MAGKFIVRRIDSGKFHFVLTATNGRTVLASEVYESKRAALKGVEAIQRLAGSASVVDETGDRRTAAARASRGTSPAEAGAPATRSAAATKATKATRATKAAKSAKAAAPSAAGTATAGAAAKGTRRKAAASTTSTSDGRRGRVAKR